MMGLRFLLTLCIAALANSSVCADPAVSEPGFTSLQSSLFAVKGSLSNAWADFDNDGDADLAVSIKGGAIRLYANSSGEFKRVDETLGLPQSGDEIRGLSWGDYDNDGDLDLLAGSSVFPVPSRSYVFRNEQTQFVEVAAEIGLTIAGRQARQSNWIDYDNDGDLDLYAANRTSINLLFNNAGGKFQMLPFAAAPTDPRRTVGACWFDADGDGDLDLFLANQSGDSDALWRNDGDGFTDIAPELEMDQTQRRLSEGGVGCAVGDYDNDGDFDLYVATYGANLLYRNDTKAPDKPRFSEVAHRLGVQFPEHTVGAAWGDYDNDGDLDLMAVGYGKQEGQSVPQNQLYRNDGRRFVPLLGESSILNVGDHGVAWVDVDNDGDLDLSVTDGYGPEGGHFLFRNELPASSNSLQVEVLDAQGNATQAGAEVRVYDAGNALIASRMVGTGGGYNAQNVLPVHFGLGEHQAVSLQVRFMGQGHSTTTTIGRIEPGAGQRITVRRPARPKMNR